MFRHGKKNTSSTGSSKEENKTQHTKSLDLNVAIAPIVSPSGKRIALIATIYLLGLFIGALDTGIVTPARTIIQNGFGIDDAFGVWMITIYTLAYAVSIPIMGKLADMYGRKGIYLISVTLFGIGSLLCGFSEQVDSYYFLLVARTIQALGGGGIMPIATAELGTTFPPEKRGMALGLVGGVYGIANIFGASAGSLILDIFGQQNWSFIFYVNVPVCIVIVLAGLFALPKSREQRVAPIDILGILVLTCMTLSLLIGLKNIDFMDLGSSLTTTNVYPYLLVALLLIPLFIVVENRAKDPVMNLSYFKNPNILITLVLSVLTGVIMMGMIFIPQFSENAMKMPSGSGGYFVIILGLFAGFGAPMSGKLIDRFGVKPVLGIGFIASIAGCLYLALVATSSPSLFNVVLSLVLIGIGMGFIMGTPLNYMMLENTEKSESNSALATLSLVRSIGTAIAPAIMVGFLVQAAATLPDQIVEELPQQVTVSSLPHAQELADQINKYKTDESTAEMMEGMEVPDFEDMQTIDINIDLNGNSDYEISDEMLTRMKDSDVTTIVATTKAMTSEMFAQMKPDLIRDVSDGINKGINGVTKASKELNSSIDEMEEGIVEMDAAISQMNDALTQQGEARSQMVNMEATLKKLENYQSVLDIIPNNVVNSLPEQTKQLLSKIKTTEDLDKNISVLQSSLTTMNDNLTSMTKEKEQKLSQLDSIQKELDEVLAQGTADQNKIESLKYQIAELNNEIASLNKNIDRIESSSADMESVISQLSKYRPEIEKIQNFNSVVDLIPESVKTSLPEETLQKLSEVHSVNDLWGKVNELDSAIATLTSSRNEMIEAKEKMEGAINEMEEAKAELKTMEEELTDMKDAIPELFTEAEEKYLALIDENAEQVETTFQQALNEGFKGMFTLVAICSLAGIIFILFYRKKANQSPQA